MSSRVLLLFSMVLAAISHGEESSKPIPGEGRRLTLLQTLDAIEALPATERGTPEEKANAAKSVSRIPNWKELLYLYAIRLIERIQQPRFPDRGDRGSAVLELRRFMEGLAAAPSDEAVQLIAPMLEANGTDVSHGDYTDPSSQSLALEHLRAMQMSGFAFKGTPPGAKEVIAFKEAFVKMERGESVVFPKVPGSLDDWRRWWAGVRPEYKSDFELPAELRALALPPPQK